MNFLGAVLVAFGVWYAAYSLISGRRPATLRLRTQQINTKKNSTLAELLIRVRADLVHRLTPPSRIERLEVIITRAGQPDNFNVDKIMTMKGFGAIAGGFVGVIYFLQNPGIFGVIVLAIGFIGGFVVPEMLISNRADARRDAVRRALPDAIDQLSVTVRAGLSLDAALIRVSTTLRGPFAEELLRVVQDIQLGISRIEALKSMATRMDFAELNYFVRSLVQADSLGIPVADTLTVQAEDMRLKRRLRAEEQALKLPVKILGPTAVCILPALMIVVLGPAIIQFTRNM